MKDETFYPANKREERILGTLSVTELEQYKELRHKGAYVMPALEQVNIELYEQLRAEEGTTP